MGFLCETFFSQEQGIFDGAKCDQCIFFPLLNLPQVDSFKQNLFLENQPL